MKNILCLFLCCLFALINFNSTAFPQIIERKKPEIKNFGSSLERTPQENLDFSKKIEGENNKDDETIKIETNLVVVDFLVLTPKGISIEGLKKEDFIVTEDTQPQEIQTFTLGDDALISRSIVLIIDYSGSQRPYIERSVEAAKLLVDKLRPNDVMALVTDDVELISQFTSDKQLLKEKLDSLKEKSLSNQFGKSLQFSSLYSVLNELFDEEDVRPIILFQTDGDQFGALKGGVGDVLGSTLPQQPLPITKFSFNDILAMIEKSRATIYTIVPGMKLLGLSLEERREKQRAEMELRRNLLKTPIINPAPKLPPPTPKEIEAFREAMKKRTELMKKYYPNGLPDVQEAMFGMSKYSGGWIDFLEKPEQANGIYSRILSEINKRYLIGYSPTNEIKDGKRRVIKVSVKDHPEYIVWGRKSYIAPITN